MSLTTTNSTGSDRVPPCHSFDSSSKNVVIAQGVTYKILTAHELKTIRERLAAIATLKKTEKDPYRRSDFDREYKAIFASELEHNAALFKQEARKNRLDFEEEKKKGAHDRNRFINDINQLSNKLERKDEEIVSLKREREETTEVLQNKKRRIEDLEAQITAQKKELNNLLNENLLLEVDLQNKESSLKEAEKSLQSKSELVSTFFNQFQSKCL